MSLLVRATLERLSSCTGLVKFYPDTRVEVLVSLDDGSTLRESHHEVLENNSLAVRQLLVYFRNYWCLAGVRLAVQQ